MDIRCPHCSALYEIDEKLIPPDLNKFKCSSCGTVFSLKDEEKAPNPQPATTSSANSAPLATSAERPIIMRSKHGVISQIPNMATLQRLIIEQKVDPDDEISFDEKNWQKVGSIPDLEPFFEVVERATQVTKLPANFLQSLSLSGSQSLPAAAPTATTPSNPPEKNISIAQPAADRLENLSPRSTLEFGFDAQQAIAILKDSIPQKRPEAEKKKTLDLGPEPTPEPANTPLSPPSSQANLAQTELPAASPPPSSTPPYLEEPQSAHTLEQRTSSPPTGLDRLPSRNSPHLENSASPGHPTQIDHLSAEEPAYSPLPPEKPMEPAPPPTADNYPHRIEPDISPPPGERQFDSAPYIPSPPATSAPPPERDFEIKLHRERDFSNYRSDEQLPSFSEPELPPSPSYSSPSFSGDNFRPEDSLEAGFFDGEPGEWEFKKGGKKKIILFTAIGVVAIVLGILIFSPSTLNSILSSLGFGEASPEALKLVEKAQNLILRGSHRSLKKAELLLNEAKNLEKKSFPSLEASRALLLLARLDRSEFASLLLEEKIKFWNPKLLKLQGELKKLEEKAAKEKKKSKEVLEKIEKIKKTVSYFKEIVNKWSSEKEIWSKKIQEYQLKSQKQIQNLNRSRNGQISARLARLYSEGINLYRSGGSDDKRFSELYKVIQNIPKDEFWERAVEQIVAAVKLRAGNRAEALETLRKIVKENKKMFFPAALLAYGEWKDGNEQQARETVKLVKEIEGTDPIFRELDLLLLPPKDLPELFKMYGKEFPLAEEKAPEKDKKTAQTAENKKVKAGKKKSGIGSLRYARRLCDRRRTAPKGIKILKRILQSSPSKRGYQILGWCYITEGDYYASAKAFRTALQLGGRNAEVYHGLGYSLFKQNQKKKACPYLQKALARYSFGSDSFFEVQSLIKMIKCR